MNKCVLCSLVILEVNISFHVTNLVEKYMLHVFLAFFSTITIVILSFETNLITCCVLG